MDCILELGPYGIGSVHKRQLFDKIISFAVDKHRVGPPVLKVVGLPLNAELREACNKVRRPTRRMRRTRAAEKALYEAAAAEKRSQENDQ